MAQCTGQGGGVSCTHVGKRVLLWKENKKDKIKAREHTHTHTQTLGGTTVCACACSFSMSPLLITRTRDPTLRPGVYKKEGVQESNVGV